MAFARALADSGADPPWLALTALGRVDLAAKKKRAKPGPEAQRIKFDGNQKAAMRRSN